LETVFEDPKDPEEDIGRKNEESEVNRRGHRIRIPVAERTDKKLLRPIINSKGHKIN